MSNVGDWWCFKPRLVWGSWPWWCDAPREALILPSQPGYHRTLMLFTRLHSQMNSRLAELGFLCCCIYLFSFFVCLLVCLTVSLTKRVNAYLDTLHVGLNLPELANELIFICILAG